MESDLKHAIAQSLECQVCLNIFNDPKILSCSHTYCKACLERLLECNDDDQILLCPVCRGETQVPSGDVNQLQTNLALRSLVEDVKNQAQVCTSCESRDKSGAVVYCQDCGKYLCIDCQKAHSLWKGFSGHDVVAMDKITSGKVLLQRRRKCGKHPNEGEEFFCSECRKYVCFRCGMVEHGNKGHQIIEASVHESDHKKIVDELKSKADKKQATIQEYIDFINERKEHMNDVTKHRIDDVTKAYDEYLRQLEERKNALVGQITRRNEEVKTELDNMKQRAEKKINHMTAMTDLVANGIKIPLELEALAAHNTLCQELQETLERDGPDYEQPKKTIKVGESFTFQKNVGKDELGLGKMVAWEVKDIALPTEDSMNHIACTPDGKMAVGCSEGGIDIFSTDGQLQKSVLKDVHIRAVEFLSDGRYVVNDTSPKLSLYTTKCEEVGIHFETLSDDKEVLSGDDEEVLGGDDEEILGGDDEEDLGGDDEEVFCSDDEEVLCRYDEEGIADLAVDSNDQIYVAYRKAEKIQVFSPEGGKMIREILCNVYGTKNFIPYNDRLIITANNVKVINTEGKVVRKVKNKNIEPHTAVTRNNSILIAWVKHNDGLVSIDEYTNELKHIQTLISNHKIEKPERDWYNLSEFRSGEIAFCTPDRLYIFHKQILADGAADVEDVYEPDSSYEESSDEGESDEEGSDEEESDEEKT